MFLSLLPPFPLRHTKNGNNANRKKIVKNWRDRRWIVSSTASCKRSLHVIILISSFFLLFFIFSFEQASLAFRLELMIIILFRQKWKEEIANSFVCNILRFCLSSYPQIWYGRHTTVIYKITQCNQKVGILWLFKFGWPWPWHLIIFWIVCYLHSPSCQPNEIPFLYLNGQ